MAVKMEAIKYLHGNLQIIDQLKLPVDLCYIPITNCQDGWKAIKLMQVRGAPAIAIVGGLSLAVDIYNKEFSSCDELKQYLFKSMDYMTTARPTAVNLFNLKENLKKFVAEHECSSVSNLKIKVIEKLESLFEEDIKCNKQIGEHGAVALEKLSSSLNILTHCNTGSLATAHYGTALGVVRSLHSKNKLSCCYFTETRPYNQGSRLTAYELVHDKIPCTMICDSMVTALMSQKHIDAVVVGADCIAANGDTANKIGTYQIAVIAKHFKVPFYIAAPTTSINFNINSGDEILIEERPEKEMTTFCGVQSSVQGVPCWNPAFDVTPHNLITGGIITELGVFNVDGLKNIQNLLH